ncbi:uncharacterized protein VP01_911g2 [Puccinia sorghi]|uniref:Uncharacterized protein n=1 Tax=Puccinia sorghi TaxID=27349 RepID=A0A0L6U7J2_9BASI|nr:uncharacterized protein VP01_911g2 [Puccinia sorghi]
MSRLTERCAKLESPTAISRINEQFQLNLSRHQVKNAKNKIREVYGSYGGQSANLDGITSSSGKGAQPKNIPDINAFPLEDITTTNQATKRHSKASKRPSMIIDPDHSHLNIDGNIA